MKSLHTLTRHVSRNNANKETLLGTRRDDGSRRKGGLGWSKDVFDAVDWPALDATLGTKGQMCKVWRAADLVCDPDSTTYRSTT